LIKVSVVELRVNFSSVTVISMTGGSAIPAREERDPG
jgi:hypothetical protein